MHIAIIGAGKVGRALAHAWTRAGHRVVLGVRDPDDPKHADLAPLEVGAAGQVVADADVIALALPWPGIEASLAPLGGLADKVVIDCTNPLVWDGKGLELDRGFGASGGEHVAALLPQAHVVKTLNQVGSAVMADATRFPARPAMFMAGESPRAKTVVAGLLADIGFEPLDSGGLIRARILEPLALVWINQAFAKKLGGDWCLHLQMPAGDTK